MLPRWLLYPSEAQQQSGGRRKLGCLMVIAGIMVLGWLIDHTVLAYWRYRMPP